MLSGVCFIPSSHQSKPPHKTHLQELQDKSNRLVDAERRFSRLEALMQRIALRTGCPSRQRQQRAREQQIGSGCDDSEVDGLEMASASLLPGGRATGKLKAGERVSRSAGVDAKKRSGADILTLHHM